MFAIPIICGQLNELGRFVHIHAIIGRHYSVTGAVSMGGRLRRILFTPRTTIVRFIQQVSGLVANKRSLTLLTIGLLLIIFFFGLRPTTWPNVNRVHWAHAASGLTFHAPGFAYADNLQTLIGDSGNQFSVCLGIEAVKQQPGFRPIVMLHDGSDEEQLSISQWDTSIIVMNGDDYSYRRKLPRLSARNVLTAGKSSCIGLTSGPKGTQLFDDGILIEERQDVHLTIPTKGARLQLVVGNSVYGNHSWEGQLYRLALYDRQLSPGEMEQYCSRGGIQAMTGDKVANGPLVLYTFGDREGQVAHDLSGNNRPLLLPSRPMALKQSFLVPPWPDFSMSKGFAVDIMLNLLGFIPLGGAIYARLRISSAFAAWYPATAAMLVCFIISLHIELAQGWLPNRSSSLLDLFLNTFGAVLGVMAIKIAWPRLARVLRPSPE